MRYFHCLVWLLAMGGVLHAQNIVAYDPAVGLVDEVSCLSPAFPLGGVPQPPAPFPALGVSIGPPLLGGMAMDNRTGIMYYSNGLTIWAGNHPAYPVIAPPLPPGSWAWTPPVPMGLINGLTIDPTGASFGGLPVAWATDGQYAVPLTYPPFTPVGPPIPLDAAVGGFINVIAPPLTGIDWDPLSGTFWACDIGGNAYNYLPGILLGVIPPAFAPPGPATGIAVDKSGGTVIPGAIYVAYPGVVIEQTSAIPSPMPMNSVGLSFHGLPSTLLGQGACGTGAAVSFVPNSPAWAGNPGHGYFVSGPAGAPALILLDPFVLVPPLAFGGGTLHLDLLFSPTFGIFPLGPLPAGPLFLPVPLTGGFPGLVTYAQVAVLCGPPSGIALSEGRQLIMSQL